MFMVKRWCWLAMCLCLAILICTIEHVHSQNPTCYYPAFAYCGSPSSDLDPCEKTGCEMHVSWEVYEYKYDKCNPDDEDIMQPVISFNCPDGKQEAIVDAIQSLEACDVGTISGSKYEGSSGPYLHDCWVTKFCGQCVQTTQLLGEMEWKRRNEAKYDKKTKYYQNWCGKSYGAEKGGDFFVWWDCINNGQTCENLHP